mmetsp:Transcript_12017/g.29198  ORF Transcript_12017/g.29198 Transcript_12017/m.29198 type:complete len:227 (+) Transcript_12017:243-923(+)
MRAAPMISLSSPACARMKALIDVGRAPNMVPSWSYPLSAVLRDPRTGAFLPGDPCPSGSGRSSRCDSVSLCPIGEWIRVSRATAGGATASIGFLRIECRRGRPPGTAAASMPGGGGSLVKAIPPGAAPAATRLPCARGASLPWGGGGSLEKLISPRRGVAPASSPELPEPVGESGRDPNAEPCTTHELVLTALGWRGGRPKGSRSAAASPRSLPGDPKALPAACTP